MFYDLTAKYLQRILPVLCLWGIIDMAVIESARNSLACPSLSDSDWIVVGLELSCVNTLPVTSFVSHSTFTQ